jgi:phage/plasmid-like protein (TIGR03299 family)
MPDMVETFAGVGATPWWAGISPTSRKMAMLEGETATWEELRDAAEIDWTVSKQRIMVAGSNPRMVNGYRAIQRDKDGDILGVTKDTYHLFQNDEGGEFAKALLSASEGYVAGFLTCGSLYGGRLVWALAKINKDLHVRGDGSPLADYLLASWGHDGRHGLTAADTMIRVVCANTLTAAVKGAVAKTTVRHTVNMASRVEEAKRALDIHRKYVETLEAVLNDLTYRPMTIEDVTNFTTQLLPTNPKSEHPYRTEAEREAIVNLFRSSPNLDGMPLTAYRAYQAVTEYLDHGKTYRATKNGAADDRRAVSIIEGSAYGLKSDALSLLVKA